MLDREKDWFERGVKEVAWVKKSFLKLQWQYKNYTLTFLGSLHKHTMQHFSMSEKLR